MRYFVLLDATFGAPQAHDTSVRLIFPALIIYKEVVLNVEILNKMVLTNKMLLYVH